MDNAIKRVLGLQEHETEDGKLRQEVVVYMLPEQIGADGAHCGACMFLRASTTECFLTDPPACNAEHGVCAAFIHGPSIFKEGGSPLKLLPKKQVGYTEEGPTRCGNCEYFEGGDSEKGTCPKVGGEIYRGGCCNGWEPGDEKE